MEMERYYIDGGAPLHKMATNEFAPYGCDHHSKKLLP
jgi:hypothetical protein